jgi:hypothetical protein
MKSISLSTGEWLLMKIPKDANDFQMHRIGLMQWSISYFSHEKGGTAHYNLPDYTQWSIIGKPLELSEEVIKTIIEWEVHEWGEICYPDGTIDDSCVGIKVTQCKDYLKTKKTGTTHYSSFPPNKSLLSLIASLELEPETTLILKKII